MKKTHLLLITLLLASIGFSQTMEKNLQQAIALYEQESFVASQQQFRAILAQEPTNEKAQEYLGSIAFELKQYQKSADYIKPLMDKYPKESRFHFKYAAAIGLYAQNNRMKAMFLVDDIKKHFRLAAELDPTFVDARMALVQLYLELPGLLGGSKEKAQFYAKEVVALDKNAGEQAMALIAAAD